MLDFSRLLLLVLRLLACTFCFHGAASGLHTAPNTIIDILHLNDFHARFEPQSTSLGPCSAGPDVCFGGFARLAAVVKERRQAAEAAGRDVLLLHAGDQFSGSIWDWLYTRQGIQVAPKFLNAMGLDAFTLGNHEFDVTLKVLAEFAGNLTAPVLSCNLEVKGQPLLEGLVKPFVIKTLLSSGTRVGIIGLTTQETAELAKAGHDLTFHNPIDALPACVAGARAEGASVIIALTHVGASLDFALAADPAAHDVDLIIGGHSHTLFYGAPHPAGQAQVPGTPPDLLISPPTPETSPPAGPYPTNIANGNKTIPVVSAFWGSRYVGVMQTTWAPSGDLLQLQGSPVLLGGANSTHPVPDDPDTATLIQSLRGPLDKFDAGIVGQTATYLAGAVGEPGTPDAELDSPARMKETNLGSLVADILISFYENVTLANGGELADAPVVSLMNGGSFRASIPEGNISQAALIAVFPFGNWVVVKVVNGSILLSALENGFSQWTTVGPPGRFPQIGGMRVEWDHTAPPGSRVVGAWLSNGSSLQGYAGSIVVVTSDYLGLHPAGDGYSMLDAAPLLLDTAVPITEILSSYIQQNSPISATTDGRIADLGGSPSPKGGSQLLWLWALGTATAAMAAAAAAVWGVRTWRARGHFLAPQDAEEVETGSLHAQQEAMPLFAGPSSDQPSGPPAHIEHQGASHAERSLCVTFSKSLLQ